MYRGDTIAAPATPGGRGAVAIVRLSGPDSQSILNQMFRPTYAARLEPWSLHHGTIVAADGAPLDEALAVLMPGPRSYTGEDVVEFHCHGSPVIVDAVLTEAIQRGARAAERGEFSRRAVLNGRMDLAQAEAVEDLISAPVSLGARAAWDQLQGALSAKLDAMRAALIEVLADIEANVDFSDEELPAENTRVRADRVDHVISEIDALLESYAASRRFREGARVVLVGKPNVGKSSLVNALLGFGRMIVSDEAGTTRDSVEELVDFGGMALVLTDTAGLRANTTRAEAAAIDRTRDLMADADLCVMVFDGSTPMEQDDRDVCEAAGTERVLLVLNKSDLPQVVGARDLLETFDVERSAIVQSSAVDESGCDELAEQISNRLKGAADVCEGGVGISRLRHRTALVTARERLSTALPLVERVESPELAAVELRSALDCLAEITDPVGHEDILDEIFSEFCIGK